MEFKETSTGGGGFFKPETHKDAVALLIEVKRFAHQVPGQYGPKDTAYVDISVFTTEADIDAGVVAFEAKGHAIQQSILARDLEALQGFATIVKLDTVPSKTPGGKPAWVWRQPEDGVKKKVAEFATKREAELKAAMESAPSFS